jgi:hypothetical protein
MQPRSRSGSRYSLPERSDRWTDPTPPCVPDEPSGVAVTTHSPGSTATPSRYEYEVRSPPPWSMVTDRVPATLPANVTVPAAAARTTVPGVAAKSTPQCPP